MSASWDDLVVAFAAATDFYVATTATAIDHWDAAGLGEWAVRDLVGHTSRSLLTLELYLEKGAAEVEVPSAVDYFRLIAASAGDPAAVAQRGRDAAVALGADLPAAVAALASRALIGELAAARGLAAPLLRAATGRDQLPVGFSVLGAL